MYQSTSLPCVWNKGTKRTKNPQANKLYEWDPLPEKYRNVVSNEVHHEFVKDLQRYSGSNNELSMWETLLTIFI